MAERQWDWFEKEIEFAAAGGRKVIVLTHIFAGATIVRNDQGEKEVHAHWKDEWTQRYFSLMRQYSNTILIEVDEVQSSCGMGVPLMDLVGDRRALLQSAEAKGPEGMAEYRRKNNAYSLDGLPTAFAESESD